MEPAEVAQKTCLEDDGAAGVAVEEAVAGMRVDLNQGSRRIGNSGRHSGVLNEQTETKEEDRQEERRIGRMAC